jgi:hypothetical protein
VRSKVLCLIVPLHLSISLISEMAPLLNVSLPDGYPVRPSFAGEEFSNNLLSDLAPLLALFGDQVTKQFMSMSLGWADNVLLATGPLGIMTVAVSAIRVGGVKKLKAITGRWMNLRHQIRVITS